MPSPRFIVDGRESAELGAALTKLTIADRLDGAPRCDAEFDNWGAASGPPGFRFFDRQLLDFGRALRIESDPTSGRRRDVLFDGRIAAIGAGYPAGSPPTISVSAEDRLTDLRMVRRTRTFTNSSDADVIARVASDHGLTPNVTVTGPTHPVLAQLNQSDLGFLRDRARSIGVELWVEGRELHARARPRRGDRALELAYGAGLRECAVVADLAGQRTRVVVSGWDAVDKAPLTGVALEDVISDELGGRASGPALLETLIGAREETVAHTVPATSEEAHRHARALFSASARRFVVARGLADFDPRLRVGAHVTLAGLGPLFTGRFYVVECQHIFDLAAGMRTAFVAEAPGIGKG